MFFRDIRPKRGVIADAILAEVHLPVRLGHRDVDPLFVLPLNARLAAAGLGSVVSHSLRSRKSGAVIGVDLVLGLTDIAKPALTSVAAMLEDLTVPHGSSLRLAGSPGAPLLFGRAEGLELSVSDEATPTDEDRQELAEICRAAIGTCSVHRGWDQQDGRTNLFFYGEEYGAMEQGLSRSLIHHPRYSGAKLQRLA